VGRLVVFLAGLLHINAFAIDPLYYVTFPNCLKVRGIVSSVEKNTVTVKINKGTRSEADVPITISDISKVLLLPTTQIEITQIRAQNRDSFIAKKENVEILKNKVNFSDDGISKDIQCKMRR
jgi:hypothetical protein